MKSTEEFFEVFRRHGMLVPAVYVAPNGDRVDLHVSWASPGQYLLADQVHGKIRVVTFPTSVLPNLPSIKGRMEVGGVSYRIAEAMPRPETDGTEMLVQLTNA